jgi:L-seryl-tRNA(Ser) seleniumtransferase
MGDHTGAIVKVHRSNFALEGFVADVPVSALAPVAAARGIPVVHDLGSGLLLSLDDLGLTGEPTARDALRAGASIVCMSGDKLLGGPQAGIMLGEARIVDALRRNPLARSYRVDKLTLAALEATLALYRDPARVRREIPILAMLSAPVDELRRRGEGVCAALGADRDACVVDSEATVGGGAFPTARIASAAISVGGDAVRIEQRLRAGNPPVIARVANGRVLLDMRAMLPASDARLAAALATALA